MRIRAQVVIVTVWSVYKFMHFTTFNDPNLDNPRTDFSRESVFFVLFVSAMHACGSVLFDLQFISYLTIIMSILRFFALAITHLFYLFLLLFDFSVENMRSFLPVSLKKHICQSLFVNVSNESVNQLSKKSCWCSGIVYCSFDSVSVTHNR